MQKENMRTRLIVLSVLALEVRLYFVLYNIMWTLISTETLGILVETRTTN